MYYIYIEKAWVANCLRYMFVLCKLEYVGVGTVRTVLMLEIVN